MWIGSYEGFQRQADLHFRVGLLLSVATLTMMTGCPSSDHPPETISDTETIPETSSANSTADREIESSFSAPHLNMELEVRVTSPEPLDVGNALVEVTGQCQFGNTITDEVVLSLEEDSVGFPALEGTLSRAANAADGTECVGTSGQREAVKWGVRFIRPAGTTQELSFEYSLTVRLASFEVDN